MLSARVSISISIAALISLNLACGGIEEELPVESQEYAFKHGPGPGPPYTYVLTTFTGETMACGGYANGTSYYSTGEWMFRVNGASGCGTKLKVMANNKCVVVKVADNGPAAWVEAKTKAKCGGTGYVLDVSPVVSKYLFGTYGSGWSDCRKVKVWKVAKSTKTGPTPCDGVPPVDDGKNWIGESCGGGGDCSTGLCHTQDYPDGMCTQACTKYCPDLSGKPITFCVALDKQNGYCFSQCSSTSSCRPGYVCVEVPRHNQPLVRHSVCVPKSLEDEAKALTQVEPEDAWIGEACKDSAECDPGTCFLPDDGYPDGMCTQECPASNLCPDKKGKPVTFCVALDGEKGYCYSRCDYDLYPTGCRQGYTCSKLPRHNQPSVKRNTCVPTVYTTSTNFVGEAPDDEGDLPDPEKLNQGDDPSDPDPPDPDPPPQIDDPSDPEKMMQSGCSLGRTSATGLPGVMMILLLCLLGLRPKS